MFLCPMNYEVLKKIFISYPENLDLFLNSLGLTHNQPSLKIISSFQLPDSSSIILSHDEATLFLTLFSQSVLAKIDHILMRIFEKACNDIFNVCNAFPLKKINISMISKEYLFHDTRVYVHNYISESSHSTTENQTDYLPSNIEALFDIIELKVIEVKKGLIYEEEGLLKDFFAFFTDNNNSIKSAYVKDLLYLINPSTWDSDDLIKYYETQGKEQKILEVQHDAFEDGFRLGQYDGQINTAYFIRGLMSEENSQSCIDQFLRNLCDKNAMMIEAS